MLTIQLISSEQVYPLRKEVLRPNLPIEESMYPTDFEEGTFHVGAFMDEELVSIVSFNLDQSQYFEGKEQYRLRGMATKEAYRGQSIGAQLVEFGIEELIDRKVDVVWCNARSTALRFYEKLGFEKYGDEFELPNIGPHFVYAKKIR